MATVNIYEMTQTWNNGATTFTAIKMDVTDTASAAGSKLLDLQIGSASYFEMTKGRAFNTYNTYTDASNYERGFMKWDANVLKIGTEAAGTGTARSLHLDARDIIISAAGGSNGLNFTSFTTFKINGAGVLRMLPATFRPQANGISLGDDSFGWAGLWGQELSADPDNPSEGNHVIWQSNGVGSGDDGDIMVKITAGGVTKTVTLIDYSAAA